MPIYLVRHGEAVPEEDAGSDRDRWLSIGGREAARALGHTLRAQQVALSTIVCSPLPRAVQTAELIAVALGFTGPICARRCLEPAGSPRIAAEDVRAFAGDHALVVSHEPLISALAALLLGRSSFPPFRTAQCHRID